MLLKWKELLRTLKLGVFLLEENAFYTTDLSTDKTKELEKAEK